MRGDTYKIGDRVVMEFSDFYKECTIVAFCGELVQVAWYRFWIFKVTRWRKADWIKGHIVRPLTTSEKRLLDSLAK